MLLSTLKLKVENKNFKHTETTTFNTTETHLVSCAKEKSRNVEKCKQEE